MKIVALPGNLKVAVWRRIGCSAVHTQAHTIEELAKKPFRKYCRHGAVVTLDEKPYCRIHAGQLLIQYALEHGGTLLPVADGSRVLPPIDPAMSESDEEECR